MKELRGLVRLAASTVAWASFVSLANAQTFSKCNPLSQSCPADQALGTSQTYDFTKGQSSAFSSSGGGSPNYASDGAELSVAKSGDSPTLVSNWYIMFGHVDVVMKPAPGVGIVSSMVLQSDDLDEVDFEWLGADNQQVQSNYFGKGRTETYNRGAFHQDPNNQGSFKKYSVDWTPDQIVWSIDGQTVRVLTPQTAQSNQYPQTPMQLKLGIWSGGDPSNAQGTIQWAGGSTDYSKGPYTMVVQSVTATDYSTGKSYSYGDQSGNWQSIRSDGGSINSNKGGAAAAANPNAPQVTDVSTGAPAPFSPSHSDPEASASHSSVWPWVATSTLQTTTTAATSIPGLPSGWTVSASGKVIPPSSAPSTPPAPPPSSPSPSPSSSPQAAAPPSGNSNGGGALPAGASLVTGYDDKGFPATLTVYPGVSKSYDQQGFLITPAANAGSERLAGAQQVQHAVSALSGVVSAASTVTVTAAPSKTVAAPSSSSSGVAARVDATATGWNLFMALSWLWMLL